MGVSINEIIEEVSIPFYLFETIMDIIFMTSNLRIYGTLSRNSDGDGSITIYIGNLYLYMEILTLIEGLTSTTNIQ